MGCCPDRAVWQEGGFLGPSRALRSYPVDIGTAPAVWPLICERPTPSVRHLWRGHISPHHRRRTQGDDPAGPPQGG
jgi:hypothetical protein